MTPEQAEGLAEIARQSATSLVARVHVEPPHTIWAHLAQMTPTHLIATAVVLAAMVPLTADPDELLAWIDGPEPDSRVLHQARPHVPDPAPTERTPAEMADPTPVDETGETEPIPAQYVTAARRVVAANAEDAEECRMLLAMLGIDGRVGEVAA